MEDGVRARTRPTELPDRLDGGRYDQLQPSALGFGWKSAVAADESVAAAARGAFASRLWHATPNTTRGATNATRKRSLRTIAIVSRRGLVGRRRVNELVRGE